MPGVRISSSFSLPVDITTESIAVLAIKRAGKSTTARKLAEGLYNAGQQVVVVDPKGDYWGMRYGIDGKSPGLPFIVLGGEHGDVPLEPDSGELVAKLVVEQRVSVIIDMGHFRKHQVTKFMEHLYHMKGRDEFKTPMMLIVDEADVIAPQKPVNTEGNLEPRMLGAAEDIVRRGGGRGIGITMITQRAAVLNKNVLTQIGVLILLRTIANQDIEAVNAWIEKHGLESQKDECIGSLPSLPSGTAWFWASYFPSGAGMFKKVAVEMPRTFDSSATPKVGEKRIALENPAQVDLKEFAKQMSETVQKIKENDPKELKRKINELDNTVWELQTALDQARNETGPTAEEIHEQIVFSRREAAESVLGHIMPRLDELDNDVNRIVTAVAGLKNMAQFLENTVESQQQERPEPVKRPILPRPAMQSGTKDHEWKTRESSSDLPPGERAILNCAAQNHDGATKAEIGLVTGYKRSSRDTYISRLLPKGYVEIQGDRVCATKAGVKALGPDFKVLPSGRALQEFWIQRLPEGEAKIFRIILRYRKGVDRESIDRETGFKRSSRDTYISRLSARRLVESVGRGQVKAADRLFEN